MPRPLRIAIVVGTFPVPSETFILRQIAGLLDLGHEVTIYAETRGDMSGPLQPEFSTHRLLERTTFLDLPPACSPWELPAWPEDGETWVPGAAEPIHNRDRLAEARVIEARCAAREPRLTEEALSVAHSGYRARSLSALHRLDRLSALHRRHDVVHAHFGPVGESFRFTRALWRAPLVVSFHGYDFCTVPRREGRDCYARLFATADAITANSRHTWARLRDLDCPEAKLQLLPMGLDPRAFPSRARGVEPGEPIRLLTVARLVEIKGHEFCLRAVAQARRQHPELRYDLVGDGPLRGRLEELARDLGLADCVTFHGTLAQPALRPLLDQAQLFLLGSVEVSGDAEGQGLALLEAQASGIPVIATRHGAFPEMVRDGETGWLVPERDVPGLAAQLANAIERSGDWATIGQSGQRWVASRFDQRRLNEQLAALYEQLILGAHLSDTTKGPAEA